MAEPRFVRWSVAVPPADAGVAAALLLDAFPAGLEQEDGATVTTLSGYLPAGEEPALPVGLSATAEPVAPGWLDAWRAFHRPVEVGPFWIGPPWLEPAAGRQPVVIDPGSAFGTGAHGSTRAAASLLLRTPARGALLDIGCGSGVLAILGALNGFTPVLAVDADPLAVTATAANADVNAVAVDVSQCDALSDPLPEAGLAVANLQLELLGPLLARPGLPPSVIVSGLLVDEPFAPSGWLERDVVSCDGWRAVRFDRRP